MNNLIIKNGASTPVDKTFEAQISQNGETEAARWFERTSGVYAGFLKYSLLVRRGNGANGSTKVVINLQQPKMITADGQQVLQHTSLAKVEFTIPDTATLDERKDLLAFIKNSLATTDIIDAVHSLKPVS